MFIMEAREIYSAINMVKIARCATYLISSDVF